MGSRSGAKPTCRPHSWKPSRRSDTEDRYYCQFRKAEGIYTLVSLRVHCTDVLKDERRGLHESYMPVHAPGITLIASVVLQGRLSISIGC